MNALTFNNVPLNVVPHNNQTYITAADLARALQYANVRAITKIYDRNQDEFTEQMTLVVKLGTKGFGSGESEKDTRIFSLRGAHLIAMLSRTPIAKEFRKWVLDVLEKEVQQNAISYANATPEKIKRCFELANKVASQVAQDIFNRTMNASDERLNGRWWVAASWNQDKPSIYAGPIENNAYITTIGQLTDRIRKGDVFFGNSSEEYADLALACHQLLARRQHWLDKK